MADRASVGLWQLSGKARAQWGQSSSACPELLSLPRAGEAEGRAPPLCQYVGLRGASSQPQSQGFHICPPHSVSSGCPVFTLTSRVPLCLVPTHALWSRVGSVDFSVSPSGGV